MQQRNDDRPYTGCAGKIAYANKSEAHRVMLSLRRRQGEKDRSNAYFCAFCGSFHIGRYQRPDRKREARYV